MRLPSFVKARSTKLAQAGLAWLGMLVLALTSAAPALAEGSRDLFPNTYNAAGARANLEWRTSSYGPAGQGIPRRTLLHVFANAGEVILMGSSAETSAIPAAAGVGGDILVYAPGVVTGPIGGETVPAPASAAFSCNTQRTTLQQGNIPNRATELAGPDTVPASIAGAYTPCYYTAPATGVYDIVITGPSGFSSNVETGPDGLITFTGASIANQSTDVIAWDVTVRSGLTSPTDLTGRLFTDTLAMFTGSNGRPIYSGFYVVTTDGYRYQTTLRGTDPNGFLAYGNNIGFFDSNGTTPLYRDVMAATGATNENQLTTMQGGAQLAAPAYPIFFNFPSTAALTQINIPLNPPVPQATAFNYQGQFANYSLLGNGGTFTYTSNVAGTYQIIISQDKVNFDPTLPTNRVLRGVRPAGLNSVTWDGNDNNGTPFPVGVNYPVSMTVQAGEYHFPMIDAENNFNGGPSYTLLNPPGGNCPAFIGGCSSAFYDDRGYKTANGTLVGTAVNAQLCPNTDGLPPTMLYSGPAGFDTTANARAFGFNANTGNPAQPAVCNPAAGAGGASAFGDKKGLDQWIYFPSTAVITFLNIVATLPTLTPTPTNTPTNTPTATPINGGAPPTPTPTNGGVPPSATPGSGAPPTATPSNGGGNNGGGGTPTPVLTPLVSSNSLTGTPDLTATRRAARTPAAGSIPVTGVGPGWQDYWLGWALWLLIGAAPVAAWRLGQRPRRRYPRR